MEQCQWGRSEEPTYEMWVCLGPRNVANLDKIKGDEDTQNTNLQADDVKDLFQARTEQEKTFQVIFIWIFL